MNISKLRQEVSDGTLRKKRMGDARSNDIKEFEYENLFSEIAYQLREEKQEEFLVSGCNRLNTAALMHEAIQGLKQNNITVLDMGMGNTTPLTEKTRKMLGVSGAMITASHQPPEYNGVKIELEKNVNRDILNLFKAKGTIISDESEQIDIQSVAISYYVNSIVALFSGLKSPSKEIVFDAMQGTSARFFKMIADRLGLEYKLNRENPHPYFTRCVNGPDPINPDNLKDLKGKNYDLVFLVDGDGDRLSVATQEGLLHASHLSIMRAKYYKNYGINTFVAEYSLEAVIKDTLKEEGIKTVGVPRGRINHIKKIHELEKQGIKAIGAETSCHHFNSSGFDDGIYTALELIDYVNILSEKRISLEEELYTIKSKMRAFLPEIRVESQIEKQTFYSWLLSRIEGSEMKDGVVVDRPDGFYAIRKSSNGPELTLNVCAPNQNALQATYNDALNYIQFIDSNLANKIDRRKNELEKK